jgi:hypothetical protein
MGRRRDPPMCRGHKVRHGVPIAFREFISFSTNSFNLEFNSLKISLREGIWVRGMLTYPCSLMLRHEARELCGFPRSNAVFVFSPRLDDGRYPDSMLGRCGCTA